MTVNCWKHKLPRTRSEEAHRVNLEERAAGPVTRDSPTRSYRQQHRVSSRAVVPRTVVKATTAHAALATYGQKLSPANLLTKDVPMANNAAIPALKSRNSQSLPWVGTRSESSATRFWLAMAGSVTGFAVLMMPSPPWLASLSAKLRESTERSVPYRQRCDHDHMPHRHVVTTTSPEPVLNGLSQPSGRLRNLRAKRSPDLG